MYLISISYLKYGFKYFSLRLRPPLRDYNLFYFEFNDLIKEFLSQQIFPFLIIIIMFNLYNIYLYFILSFLLG